MASRVQMLIEIEIRVWTMYTRFVTRYNGASYFINLKHRSYLIYLFDVEKYCFCCFQTEIVFTLMSFFKDEICYCLFIFLNNRQMRKHHTKKQEQRNKTCMLRYVCLK